MGRLKMQDAEENVACNLIPMIDIMFLLLLFFMLSADMTQRVAEDIKIPIAEMVKEEAKEKEGYESTTVNLVNENDKWFVKIAGHSYPDWADLKATLLELSKDSPEPGNPPPPPGVPPFSSRAIRLRAEQDAPYREVQRLIQLCSATGLYKIEVVASKPTADKP